MDSTPVTDPAPRGRIVGGRYRLGERIGKGGRGEVYLAVQLDLAREVAIKLVPDIDEEARARFLHEARVAASIRHPCVVEIFDAGVDASGTPYCAMELLEGETLAARIEREGALPVEEVVALAAGIASALAAVHDKGFLHRDVKPSNVFLAKRQDGGLDPKLIDFGIAKPVTITKEIARRATASGIGPSRGMKPTSPGMIVGTPRYLAPEQILGGDLDVRVDVYALGATVHEALTGEPPFLAEDMGELLARIVCSERESLRKRAMGGEIPAAIDREVRRAIAKKREDRHAGAAEFAQALWAALASAKRGVSSDPPAEPPPARVVPERRSRAITIGVIALMIATAMVFLRLRRAPLPAATTPITIAPGATAMAPSATAIAPSAAPPDGPESAQTTPPTSALPVPKAKGARASAPTSRAPFAPSAAPAAAPPTDLRMDDLKAPY